MKMLCTLMFIIFCIPSIHAGTIKIFNDTTDSLNLFIDLVGIGDKGLKETDPNFIGGSMKPHEIKSIPIKDDACIKGASARREGHPEDAGETPGAFFYTKFSSLPYPYCLGETTFYVVMTYEFFGRYGKRYKHIVGAPAQKIIETKEAALRATK